jgi:hypothetical protein
MEFEVKYRDPTGRVHRSRVRSQCSLIDPTRINNAVFRAGKNLIFTERCPYNGTQVRAMSFRLRPLGRKCERVGDWFWNLTESTGEWSKWYDYQSFFDQCFPAATTVTTIVRIKQGRRHA